MSLLREAEDYELVSYSGSSDEEEDEYAAIHAACYGYDDFGDGSYSETFESKFGPLKRFALTVHTGKYDNDIELELSNIVTNVGNVHEVNPADSDERKAIAAENLKSQLKALTHEADFDLLSNITCEENPPFTTNDATPILSHDPSFDEYWQEFFTALNKFSDSNMIQKISIRKIEMRRYIVEHFMWSLHGRATLLKFISFNNTNLCREGLLSISTLVEQCPVLETLELSHNPIDDINVATCLSRALTSHPRKRTIYLHLTYCNLGNNPEILSVILQSEVRCINLHNNNIDSLGVVKIVECIESNSPVQSFGLSNNNLNDEDALAISRALKRNTNLTRLNLEQNNFTSVGVKALFSSVFDNSSLNAISQSNHTCELEVVDFGSKIQENFRAINACDETDKILLALLDKESLLEYFSDVPIECTPEVLALLQRNNMIIPSLRRATSFYDYMEPSHTLNMLYSSMRWWNMPSLYSFQGNVVSGIKRKRNSGDA